MFDLARLTPHELRVLLGCQEYKNGWFAHEIKVALSGGWDA